jgi:hypothetical protein
MSSDVLPVDINIRFSTQNNAFDKYDSISDFRRDVYEICVLL